MAGCSGSVVGAAGCGCAGEAVVRKRRESVFVLTVVSSPFATHELLPELCYLMESNKKFMTLYLF